MSIVKMSRMTLVALETDKQRYYDEIVRLGCIHIGECQQIEYKIEGQNDAEEVRLAEEKQKLSDAMSVLSDAVARAKMAKETKEKIALPKNPMTQPRTEVDCQRFFRLKDAYPETMQKAKEVRELEDERKSCLNEAEKLSQKLSDLQLYLPLAQDPSCFVDTPHAFVALATLPNNNVEEAKKLFAEQSLAGLEVVNADSQETLVSAFCHKSAAEFWGSLSQLGFRRTETLSELPKTTFKRLQAEKASLENRIKQIETSLDERVSLYGDFQLMTDWLNLCYKVCKADDDCGKTAYTFVLNAYTPEEKVQQVKDALLAISDDVILQFDQVESEEFAPTLCKNNKVVTPFESVTNMYMAPNYHEPDPNPIMSIFYFLIFGLMTADVGYGLVLAVAGLLFSALIKQRTGMKQLAGLIGICGFSTILWGFAFGSFFSLSMNDWFGANAASWYPILPSPSEYPIVTMVLSLLLGILHLMAGVACNGYKQAKRGKVLDGILDALPWEVFFVGLIILAAQPACGMMATPELAENCKQVHIQAIVQFAQNTELGGKLMQIGLYIIIGALAFVALTAGRHNKGILGKAKGGFGGVYGVINYFSDVVSYVRIFGLMLSGAVFGAIINQIVAEMLFPMGVGGYIGGAVVLVLFHLFNLALAVLGAYVHNARLQYVEYFGKFYEGEGVLFTPLGSDLEYTLIK